MTREKLEEPNLEAGNAAEHTSRNSEEPNLDLANSEIDAGDLTAAGSAAPVLQDGQTTVTGERYSSSRYASGSVMEVEAVMFETKYTIHVTVPNGLNAGDAFNVQFVATLPPTLSETEVFDVSEETKYPNTVRLARQINGIFTNLGRCR